MAMRRSLVFSAVAIAYVAALFALAPASLVDAALDRATDGRVRLTASRGSLWTGSGALELRDPPVQSAFARAVEWRLKPAMLLAGELAFEIRPRGGDAPFTLTLSWRRVELAAARMSVPAAALGIVLPQLAPLELTGNVLFDVPALVWTSAGLEGGARLRWSAAGSALAKPAPLGSYELRLDCSRSVARMALTTVEGVLELNGSGAWTLGERPALRASARVPASHRAELAPLLALVGVEREPGRFELELK